MAEAVDSHRLIRFGSYEADLSAGELKKCGVKLELSGQPFQVLAILLEQPGTIVTREELQKRLWPDTFVDVDHNLNTAINKIREALGDSSDNPLANRMRSIGNFQPWIETSDGRRIDVPVENVSSGEDTRTPVTG